MNILKSSQKPAARLCASRLLALFMLAGLLVMRIQAQTFNVTYSFNSTNATGSDPTAPVIQGPDNTLYGTTQSGGSGGAGVVFKIQPDGTGYTVLWNFSGGNDGSNPNAGLLLSGNTLYGTAYNGGSSGYGVIFAVNTDGSGFTNLYSFTGGLDCGNPYAGLILSGSTLYGTTTGESSGIQYYGSIFKINTNGSGFAVLKTFKIGDGTGANPYGGLILSGSLLYGTTESGTPGYGTVFRLSTSGAGFSTVYSFTNGNDGGNPYGGVVLSGNELYGTTLYGGAYSSGTVFKINTGGGGFTVLHSFGSVGSDGLNPSAGLILSGNTLYGTASGGGTYNSGTIYSINPNDGGLTNLYNFDGTNGNYPEAALLSSGNTLIGTTPFGGTSTGGTVFAVALFGLPIITNQPESQIIAAGSTVNFSVGAGGGAPLGYQWMSNNVPVLGATNATLALTNVSLDASGNYSVLVTNTYFNIQLQAYTNSSILSSVAILSVVPVLVTNQPISQTVPAGSTVSFSVGVVGVAPLNYQWSSNSIVLPDATNDTLILTNVSLAASATYSILISNSYGSVMSSNAVLTVLPASEYVSPTFLFLISSNSVPGGFWPNFLTLDNSNNIYVTDQTSNCVVKFDKNGNYLTKFGNFGSGNGQFEYPAGIAMDSGNNLYVTDTGNNRIEKFDSSGTYIKQWGTTGSDNGQFEYPAGIAVDSGNNLYVTDSDNNRIEKFDSSGTYITQWGTLGGGNGQFSSPRGVAVDSSDNVYVADIYNNRIEKFSSDGAYLTQWGAAGSSNSQFNGPEGIVVDSNNNVYVTDSGNGRIEKFTSKGTYLTQWGSDGSGNGKFNGLGGIALDNSGNYIYVVDTGNGRIQVFVANTNIIPPSITQSPANQTVAAGLNATFNVSVAGSPPFAYKWISNNIAVPGATNASFTLTNVSFAAAGSYSVLVTNNFGSVLSDPAILAVTAEMASTQPATGISATGAVLNGSVTIGPDETLAWFEWGMDTNYGNIAGATILPGDYGSNNISATLNGLPGNIYHYRIYAANAFGITFGNDQVFTVGLAPTATTLSATGVTGGSILNGAVNPNGWDTTVYFIWGTAALTNVTPVMDAVTGTSALKVSSLITNLVPGIFYSYKLVASNNLGVTFGQAVPLILGPWTIASAPNTNNWDAMASSADGTKLVAVSFATGPAGAIYVSTNSAASWNVTTAPMETWETVASSADGTKLIAGGGGGYGSYIGPICTSTNSGATWITNNAPIANWQCVASSADGNKLVAVDLIDRSIFTSTNGGANWNRASNAPSQYWYSVASSADGNKLVAVCGGYYTSANGPMIYTSTNSGATWALRLAFAGYWTSVASSADGNKLVAVGGGFSSHTGPIYTSTDAGVTWHPTTAPSRKWINVTSSADGTILAAAAITNASGSPVYTSTDSGASWKPSSLPVSISCDSLACSADGAELVAGVGYPQVGGIFYLRTIPVPKLNLSVGNSQSLLSWIIPSLDFTLQQSSDLVKWADVTNSPVLNLTNLQDQITLPPPSGNSFFRLQSQ